MFCSVERVWQNKVERNENCILRVTGIGENCKEGGGVERDREFPMG